MNDQSPTRLWLMRAAFFVLALVILFFHLLPLETTPRRWAGPDVLLAFACAWCLRRPEYVPSVILALAFLLADLLLQRPPAYGPCWHSQDARTSSRAADPFVMQALPWNG
ncbi:hypothetical protein [Sulfitobacter aestuariivivens]|uniref:hypothetical protein n=1 Tax=Sulfitobacter aestuariivivens TaxID=2766981 RepID=UPI0036228745